MDMLVSTDWLASQIAAGPESSGIVILDASAHLPDAQRDARVEFAAAHIPGARFLDLSTLIDPDSAVPAAIPTAAQFAARLGSLGVSSGDQLVIYDDSAVKTSARAWFIARLHGAPCAILDGGLGKWRAEGRPLESGAPPITAASYQAGTGTGLVRSKADMIANLTSRSEQVVDARGAARFSGAEGDFRPNVASGHIPGSLNLPFGKLYNPDGTFKSAEGLRAAFADAGVDIDAPIATTCGGGVTAAVLLFALGLLGQDQVSLYDGSWSEWGTDPATPKELSPEVAASGPTGAGA